MSADPIDVAQRTADASERLPIEPTPPVHRPVLYRRSGTRVSCGGIRARLFAFAAALLVTLAPVAAAAQDCTRAGAQAEREYDLPAGLLHAISIVESGHGLGAAGEAEGWPWTTDVGGQDHYWPAAADAVAAVQALLHAGSTSVDVGCFQINLLYHPDAFPDIETAFEPLANARAAARFLVELHRQTGDWADAIMRYHSAAPARGPAYRDRVLAVWLGTPAGSVTAESPAGAHGTAPESGSVHVWTPANALTAASSGAAGMPSVIFPQYKR